MILKEIERIEKDYIAKCKENLMLKAILEETPDKKPYNCKACKNFIQHYVLDEPTGFKEIWSGQCKRYKTTTRKKPDGKTCMYFEMK